MLRPLTEVSLGSELTAPAKQRREYCEDNDVKLPRFELLWGLALATFVNIDAAGAGKAPNSPVLSVQNGALERRLS